MSQSFNLPGIRHYLHMIANPRLVIPHYSVGSLADINPQKLRRLGIKAVALDKDNTLTDPYKDEVNPLVAQAVKDFRRVFGKRVAILSNHAGTKDDRGGVLASHLETSLGLPTVRHEEKKPALDSSVAKYFGCEPYQLAIIGDRISTDVGFAHVNGCLAILTQAFTEKGDNFPAIFLRRFERGILNYLLSRGVSPPYHPLYDDSQKIIN